MQTVLYGVVVVFVLALALRWFFSRQAPEARPEAPPAPEAAEPEAPAPAKLPALHLDVYEGDLLARSEVLERDVVKIGHDQKSHLRLEAPKVNRLHAVIEVNAPDAVSLIDLGTHEGTVLNGARIHRAPLRHGDVVVLGEARVVVGVGAPPPRAAVAS